MWNECLISCVVVPGLGFASQFVNGWWVCVKVSKSREDKDWMKCRVEGSRATTLCTDNVSNDVIKK